MTPEEIVAKYYGSYEANLPLLELIREAIAATWEEAAQIAETHPAKNVSLIPNETAAAIRAKNDVFACPQR